MLPFLLCCFRSAAALCANSFARFAAFTQQWKDVDIVVDIPLLPSISPQYPQFLDSFLYPLLCPQILPLSTSWSTSKLVLTSKATRPQHFLQWTSLFYSKGYLVLTISTAKPPWCSASLLAATSTPKSTVFHLLWCSMTCRFYCTL